MASSFTPSRILLFGGTGTIGRFITTSLLTSTTYTFPKPEIFLFTSPASATSKADLLDGWKAQGLAGVITGDLTLEADVVAAYKDHAIDTVISAVGRGGLQHQLPLLKLAEASDTVRWFLPSEYGTDIEHNEKSPGEKTHQVKLAVRKYVREHLRKVKVTYVVTGPYFDMWVNPIPAPGLEKAGGFAPAKKEAYVIDDGEGKVGFCTMEDVGKFVTATIQHPDVAFGKALKVQSFVVSPNEVLAEYEKQTNSKFTVNKTPLDEIRALETKAWESASPAGAVLTLRRIWAEGGTLYEKNDNEVLGLGPQDLDSLEVGVKKALQAAATKQ